VTTKASQRMGFKQLEAALRSGTHHPLLLIRPSLYSAMEHDQLVRDIIALANVPVRGQRFIVLGAKPAGESRIDFVGLSQADHMAGFTCAKQASNYIEPPLRIDYVQWPIGKTQVGVLAIDACENPPYLARCDVAQSVRTGDAWVRGSEGVRRMTRRDWERCFQDRYVETPFQGEVRVQFSGAAPADVIRLPVVDLSQLPSRDAAERVQALLTAKEAARSVAGTQHTYISRLSYARVFGGDQPYIDKGVETLRTELSNIADGYRQRDAYYKFEQQAHRVNLALQVESECAIENASLVLHIPANAGLEIAQQVLHDDAAESAAGLPSTADYPNVEVSNAIIRVSATFDSLTPGKTVLAFDEALRVYIGEAAAGFKFPVRYELRGRNLRRPLTGKLYIVCPTPAAISSVVKSST